MSIKSKVLLAIFAVIGGTAIACGSTASDPNVSGNSSADAGTDFTGWFEPAATYNLAWEDDEGGRIEATVLVGDPYKVPEVPTPNPDVTFEGCVVNVYGDEVGPGDTVFPVFWEFANVGDYSQVAGAGVEPRYFDVEGDDSASVYVADYYDEPEDYEEGAFYCHSYDQWSSDLYDLSSGTHVDEEGLLIYKSYTPGSSVYPRVSISFDPWEDESTKGDESEDWYLVEFTGPGVDFEGQMAEYGSDVANWNYSYVTLLLPVGRESVSGEIGKGGYTNGYTGSGETGADADGL